MAQEEANPEDINKNQDGNQDQDNEDADLTLEELLAAAQAAGQAARLVTISQKQLKKGMEILYPQGDKMTWQCDEIAALNLSELELTTLMRQYALQPQKLSLPGPSAAAVPNRLRLTENLKRLTGHISSADAKEFQTISDELGKDVRIAYVRHFPTASVVVQDKNNKVRHKVKYNQNRRRTTLAVGKCRTYAILTKEEIEMTLLVDAEARFTISSTLEAKAPYLELPENWERWETEWKHGRLVYYVSLI
jgi:hypothetical protein